VKYDVVNQSLEEYVQANWSDTDIQFDNVAFNADFYTEYMRCTIVFGDTDAPERSNGQRSVVPRCYRVMGFVLLDVFVKPAIGVVRMLELGTIAANLLRSKAVHPVAPLQAPVVNFQTPTLTKNTVERHGWVSAQVSAPFYYDFMEI
jgi:hypothetical protein